MLLVGDTVVVEGEDVVVVVGVVGLEVVMGTLGDEEGTLSVTSMGLRGSGSTVLVLLVLI